MRLNEVRKVQEQELAATKARVAIQDSIIKNIDSSNTVLMLEYHAKDAQLTRANMRIDLLNFQTTSLEKLVSGLEERNRKLVLKNKVTKVTGGLLIAAALIVPLFIHK